MKLLFDFLPILLFFASFKLAASDPVRAADLASSHFGFLVSGGVVGPAEAPVLLATLVVIAATLAQIAWLRARGRPVDKLLWVSLGLVVVLGGATVWFHSETFIKWKPSVLYWAMGLGLWISRVVFRRNPLQALLGHQIALPAPAWQRLNFAWIAFFGLMGLLNLWVAYSFSTDTWVNFKLFGGVGLLLLFTLAQGLYLSRYLKSEALDATPPGPLRP